MSECERCEKDVDDLDSVTINDEHTLCPACRDDIEERIENYYWYDRYTDEQHERAMELLEEQDEILCAHDYPRGGEIIVHTNYVSSTVINDIREHFGFQIMSFGPEWEQDDSTFDCVQEHGSCFEICLNYRTNSPPPLPLQAKYKETDLEYLDENAKQFSVGE